MRTVPAPTLPPARGGPSRIVFAALCWIVACQPAEIPAERPGILLISVDTLRADHLSIYGYEHETSPALDAWARRDAAVFENAIVQAPWTLPSHASMLTGLDATRHGVNFSRAVAPPTLVTVAERLRAAGYATAAVTAGGWFHPDFGLAQGFDHYRYWADPENSENELEDGLERALEILATSRPPLFLFFHTFEVHDFQRREPPPAPAANDARSEARRRYDRGISRTDRALRRLLDATAGQDRSRWIVLFTSDHGEGFGDARAAGHGYLLDNILRVPMILSLPDGRGAGRRVRHPARSIDIVPTLLDAASLPLAAGLDGTSLLPAVDGREMPTPVTASYAPEGLHGLSLRVGDRWKYTLRNSAWSGFHGRDTLYDLRDDPGELDDLGAGHPRAERMRAAARRMLDEAPGLHLRFANARTEPLIFEISAAGGWISRHAVTATDLPCECVTRTDVGRFTVEVPPGLAFEILLELWTGGALALEIGEPSPFRAALEPADLEGTYALRWQGRSWGAGPSEQAVSTGVEIRRRGLSLAAGGSPIDRDPEVRRQLRALGYLD